VTKGGGGTEYVSLGKRDKREEVPSSGSRYSLTIRPGGGLQWKELGRGETKKRRDRREEALGRNRKAINGWVRRRGGFKKEGEVERQRL